MKVSYIIVIILTASTFFSCKTSSGKTDYEKEVLMKLIPTIVDSICQDPRIFLSPPPLLGEFMKTKNEHYIIDTSLATATQKIKYLSWKRKQDSILNDTSKIILAFNPKISKSKDDLEKKFIGHFKIKLPIKQQGTNTYILNYQKIKLNGNFAFKDIKEFQKSSNVWNNKYNFVFSGFFHISKILFDENKTHGILSASYSCGDRCGEGFIVYIKKVNNVWVIDKLEGAWIA